MPEDAIAYLDRYIQYAKLGNDEVAPSFRNVIWKVDAKVNQSYANAFIHLASSYWFELNAKDWSDVATASTEESAFEQLEEAAEWLCSVANDARRIVNDAVITNAIGISKSRKKNMENDSEKLTAVEATYELIEVSNTEFSKCLERAVDYLACIMFRELSRAEDNEVGFLNKNFFYKWEEDARSHSHLLLSGDNDLQIEDLLYHTNIIDHL
jgi:hypothetical protein